MQTGIADRIFHARGRDAYELGVDLGQQLGARLAESIQQYLYARLAGKPAPDPIPFQGAAMEYVSRLPERFRAELQGLSAGARLPLEWLAEWVYLEPYLESGCTGAICLLDGHAWLARNNDIFAPHLWGYVTIREMMGRIPTVTFGLLGDIFTPTGVNRDRLWLHYNFLPAWDQPAPGKEHLPPYAFLVEALETCSTLQDVEKLLDQVDRDGGMLLFAVDGKTDAFALYECTCQAWLRRDPSGPWLVGANHFAAWEDSHREQDSHSGSIGRQRRMEELVQRLYASPERVLLPAGLIRILADDGIEGRDPGSGTAYANVACPNTGELWYTFGGYPAASKGRWARLAWPW